nr:hypothetical protein [Tanacetum cinerariifolium]
MMIYLRNVAGFRMKYLTGMTYDDIRPIFEKKFNSNVAFLQKTKEKMDEEDSRALKRLSESQEEMAAKKMKRLQGEMTKCLRLLVKDLVFQGKIIADMDADKDVTLKGVATNANDVKDVETEESSDVQGRQAESQLQIYQIDLEHAHKVLSMQDVDIELTELQEVVELVSTTKLITEVVTAASATITTTALKLTTAAAPTLTTPSVAIRRKRVVIRNPEESATPSIIIHSEAKSKEKGKGILVEEPKPLKKQAQIKQDKAYARELQAKLNKNIDWDEVSDHVKRKQKEDNAVKRYQELKRNPQTKAQARKNMMIYLRNVVGFKMDYFKGMTYDDIRPIFEKNFNSNVAFLQKTKEQMDKEDSRALKRLSESREDKATKKQKLDESSDSAKYDLAGREKISTFKVYSGSNAQQEMTKCLRLLVKDLVFQGRIIADKDVTLKDVVADAKDVKDAKTKEKPTELQEIVEVVITAKLITEVVTVASVTFTDAAPKLTTAAAPTLTTATYYCY